MGRGAMHLAIERAYDVFARYARPAVLEASPVKNADAILRSLSLAPLRDLSEDKVGPYAGSALYTVGNVQDYKHFLPRILEIAFAGSRGWVGCVPPAIANHLVYARWRDWPTKEVDAVRLAFQEGWTLARDQNPNGARNASEWLCALSILEEPIDDLLDDWLDTPSVNAVLQLADFVGSAPTEMFGRIGDAAYWSSVDEGRRQKVASWMLTDPVAGALGFARRAVGEEDLWSLDRALDVIRPRGRRPS